MRISTFKRVGRITALPILFLSLHFLCLADTTATGRTGEVFILSQRVGPFVDRSENRYYQVFDIPGFLGGQFFYYPSNDSFFLSIAQYRENGKYFLRKSLIPKIALYKLKDRIESIPEISDSLRTVYSLSENEEYYRYVSSFLSTNKVCKVYLNNGTEYTGLFYRMHRNTYQIQKDARILSLPMNEIRKIEYWDDYQIFPWAFKGTYIAVSLAGLAGFNLVAKLANVDRDLLWYYRFSGAAAGLIAAYWLDDYVNEFFNPPQIYELNSQKKHYFNNFRVSARKVILFLINRFKNSKEENDD